MLEPVARWVLRQGPEEDTLRWSLINDERLKVIERSKLLERLIGRAHEPDIIKRAETLLLTTEEELLRVACENLSTAASELSRMSTQSSGLCFFADATCGAQHHLQAGLDIEGPFTSTRLVFRFPRWVPGSYFLREPIQHMFDFSASDEQGRSLNWKTRRRRRYFREPRKGSSAVSIRYMLLAEGVVRPLKPLLDSTHLHLMPPFTWFWPERGVEEARLDMTHRVELLHRRMESCNAIGSGFRNRRKRPRKSMDLFLTKQGHVARQHHGSQPERTSDLRY